MKLEKITRNQTPGYPSFKAHRLTRRGMLKSMFGGLAFVLAGGCINPTGEIPKPIPKGAMPATKPSVTNHPPKLGGDIIMPNPPPLVESPTPTPAMRGEMPAAEQPPKIIHPDPFAPRQFPRQFMGMMMDARPPRINKRA